MPRKRILLFGEQGQVAWELRRTLAPMADLTCVGRTEVDLADPAAIRRAIAAAAPEVIVNAAAYTAVDKAETETALATMLVTNALSCTRHYYWSKWYDAFKRAHGPLPVPYAGTVPIWDTAHDETVLANRKKLVR